jgi:hypothetical protein
MSARLCEFDGRNGPFPIVALDRDSQAVHFVQPPNTLHRTGLSVGEDHGFADKLGLGMFELTEDRGRADLRSWHGSPSQEIQFFRRLRQTAQGAEGAGRP